MTAHPIIIRVWAFRGASPWGVSYASAGLVVKRGGGDKPAHPFADLSSCFRPLGLGIRFGGGVRGWV
jgi:hypothetical protein